MQKITHQIVPAEEKLTRGQINWKNNKKKMLISAKKWNIECLKSWEGLIPKEYNCMICGREIYFNKENRLKAINFDHRMEGGEDIKGSPAQWLSKHRRNSKNEIVWKNCRFGMLCLNCNTRLPTKNRKEWMESACRYVFGDDGRVL